MEYSPSGGDDEEDDNEDELESYDDDDNDNDDELDRQSDLLHLIADLGHHREVNCTVRFSNSDSNGPEVFEATVNNDDLKPPARRTVLPTPPVPLLDDAEEEEEETGFHPSWSTFLRYCVVSKKN